MLFVYSILLALGFVLMSPLFLFRRKKYAAGFRERLGKYPAFPHDGSKVIWLHCVSVGETNAARPLVAELVTNFPDHRLIVSTTTKTGQELAKKIFAANTKVVFYLPFDFKFSVRRALEHFKPSLVLLMETEIWPRFIHEAKRSGAKVAIINGRLSERSVSRYSLVRPFVSRVLNEIDLALMQGSNDANRLISLGMPAGKTVVTGNIKFDQTQESRPTEGTKDLNRRFAFSSDKPLIVAASTHEPEESWLLEAWSSVMNDCTVKSRLMIVPRHPERFEAVAELIEAFRNDPECEWRDYFFARRSLPEVPSDRVADVILLDTIGELREVYPLAEIVFVGGSLIPHGGQSVIEPAVEGKAVVTGPYTENFASVVEELLTKKAIRQTAIVPQDFQIPERLYEEFLSLLESPKTREELGRRARAVTDASRGATEKTIAELRKFISGEVES